MIGMLQSALHNVVQESTINASLSRSFVAVTLRALSLTRHDMSISEILRTGTS